MARHNKITFSKLTPEQQEFAEANHIRIYYHLHKHNLPIDEYYDLAAIGFVKAVKLYFTREDLQKYAFSTVFEQMAHNVIHNNWRDNKRIRRIPKNTLRSLDIPEIRSALEYEGIQTQGNLWDNVEYQDLLNDLCQYATDRQRRILQMLLDGYANTEIQKTIGISPATLWRDRQYFRNRIIELGILEPRCMATKR